MANRTHFIESTIRTSQNNTHTTALSQDGALMVRTGAHTGRAAQARFIVRYPEYEKTVDWGPINQPIEEEFGKKLFSALQKKLGTSSAGKYQGIVGGLPIEVTSTSAWHLAFAENMFRDQAVPSVTSFFDTHTPIRIYHDPSGKVSDYGLKSTTETILVLDFKERTVCIVGTAYAGEIKKSAFTLCNYLLPEKGVLPMHASANCMQDGSESCVLFGLSGTGKTTLSASPDRFLIGDDEIIWTPRGISNLEGGCYAKLIGLDPSKEPEIYKAANRFGSILENVVYDETTRQVDFMDASITENTRGSYSIEALEKVFDQNKEASPPKTIIFLTADAFGALPAVARLNPWQAQYHFVSGYTAKVAGTEIGVKEPQAVFSACFGAPFMPRPASLYAEMLAEKIKQQQTRVWLLNTGWTQGGYGKGDRFPIAVSRTLLKKIQSGELDQQPMQEHPIFGFQVPKHCPDVPNEILSIPQGSEVQTSATRFKENAKKTNLQMSPEVIRLGGPRLP